MKRLVECLSLLLALSLWLPAVYGGFTVQRTLNEPTEAPPPTPTPSPDSGSRDTPTTITSWSEDERDGLDFLVAAFFFIAAGWLVLALIYSLLVVIVVWLRARGQLDVYDENFGRFYLVGTRCYIPLGCVLRLYIVSLNQEENGGGDPGTVRLMTREERRMAMELLLSSDEENVPISGDCASTSGNNEEEVVLSNEPGSEEIGHADQFAEAKIEEEHDVDEASNEEPVCTICLAEYEPTDVCFTSTVCSHRYHHGCIMDWLERRANTECPCCRTRLVSDEEVWETVQNLRRERRRQIRKANRGQGLFPWFRRGNDRPGDEETVDPTPPPSPYRSFERENVDNDVERDSVIREENDPPGISVDSEAVTVEGRF